MTAPQTSFRPGGQRPATASGGPWARLRSRRPLIVVVVAALVAGLLVVLAVNAEGYPVTDVDLADSTVWVTNDAKGVVGRVNRQIDELNSAVKANKPDFDVLQEGDTVLVVDSAKSELRPIDVATVALAGRIGIPESAAVSMANGVVGIVDHAGGALWAGTPESLTGLDPATTEPLLNTAAGAAVVVSDGGTVFAVAPGRDELWSITIGSNGSPQGWGSDDKGAPVPPEPARLPGGALSAAPDAVVDTEQSVSITTVGDTPVILDQTAGEVVFPDHRVSAPGGGQAVLQQPGPASDAVLIATATGLWRVPLAGGGPVAAVQGVTGAPSAPVLLGGCAHGAWADQQSSYALACGTDAAQVVPVPDAGAAARLIFRVNRDVIVLNDHATGDTWLVDADMKLISNWDEVQPQEDSSESTSNEDGENSSNSLNSARTDCAPGATEIKPPAAAADEFGVRAGRSTVLPVLDNDASADCSMVVISAVSPLGSDTATVAIANSGQALQVTVAAGADSGPLAPITYTVDDGLGRQATATVTLTVADADAEAPAPIKVRDSATLVEVAGTVSYGVLPDFVSPFGDDLHLTSASTVSDDTVTYQPNGMITFQDSGSAGAVKKTVDFTISDGTNQTQGTLVIDVKPDGSTKPTPGPVHAAAVVNEAVIVDPLRSVLSGSPEPAKITSVQPLAAGGTATASLNPVDSSVTLAGTTPGTSYFAYTVVAGAASATGVIRFDVAVPADVPPVVTPDVGYLIPGRTLVIDPLTNDRDPAGKVLAVQQLTQPAGSPLTATVSDLHLIQVSSARKVPEGGVTLTYTASNAFGGTTGQIRVIPVQAPVTPQRPVATDFTITVRAGDAVTIPIAKYASDPSGELLTVQPFPADALPPEKGLVFATESSIRYLAPATQPATTVQFSYSVVNTSQVPASGKVTVSVTPADPVNNASPRTPEQVTARVFAGRTATIGLPLNGLDPDGDWVTYAGQSEPAPLAGRVDRAGPSAVTYTALGQPGLDTFGYLAADPFGKQVTGTVRVAVVAPPPVAEPPVAPDLSLVVRPGRTVAIDVLGSASDPGGNTPFTLGEPALVLPPGIDAEIADNAVVATAPPTEGVFPIKYTVLNSKGLAASGILTVTVSATLPLAPPTARDIFVEPGAVAADGNSATVDATSSVSNRSGQVSDLTLAMDASAGSAASVDGLRITVSLAATRQVLAYQVTNLDGDSAKAFVVVPPKELLVPPQQQDQQQVQQANPPQPKANVEPFSINAGQTATVPVLNYVDMDGGRTAQVPPGASMNASQGTVSRLDESSVQYTVPETASGSAVINVQVSDGVNAPVFIPIPVIIIPTVPPPPVFTGASMTVETGSTATQDLARLVSTSNDQQRDSLVFNGPTGLGSGLSGTLTGSTLTVTADPSAPKGTTSTATISVSDGSNSVDGTVTVSIVGSTAALATVPANRQVEATAGQSVSIPVLDGAYNPFPETPLTIVSASTSNGVPAQVSGSSITVTPPAGSLEQFTVSFEVTDATGDIDRQVQGIATVIPQARPEAPTAVEATSLSLPDSVDVRWNAPALVRPAITSFTVYWSGGSTSCPATAGNCAVGPLTPGTEYTFEVSATNSLGEGVRSAPSGPITPDVEPNAPAAPTATYTTTRTVTVSWSPPAARGTPVNGYELQIRPADSLGRSVMADLNETTVVWDSLDVRTAYTFQVRAKNSSATPGQWSNPSAPVTPYGVPDAPESVAASWGDGFNFESGASWVPPSDDGGSDVVDYVVRVQGPSSNEYVIPGASSSTGLGQLSPGSYTVTVAARNQRGTGPTSATTFTAYDTPSPVASVSAAPTGNSGELRVNWSDPPGTHPPYTSYEVVLVPSADQRSLSPSQREYVWSGLTNGQSYSFQVYPCWSAGNGDGVRCSPGRGTGSASPYAPLSRPSISASTSGTTIQFDWSFPDGGGRAVVSRTVTISGVGEVPAANGSWSGDIGYSTTRDATARMCVSDGDCTEASASARTVDPPPPPPPSIAASRGSAYTGGAGGCTTAAPCYRMNFTVNNFSGTFNFACENQVEGTWWNESHAVSSGGTYTSACYLGRGFGSPRITASGVVSSNWVAPWP